MDHYIGGAFSGCIQALAGHPLDTIKTWQQNRIICVKNLADFTQIFACEKKKSYSKFFSFRNHTSLKSNFRNWKSLYRGLCYPLFGSTVLNFFYFGIQDDCYRVTQNYYAAGALTGLVTAPFTSWFELNKIRLQVIDTHPYQWYRGMGLTILREVPAMAIYFGSYQTLMKKKYHPLIAGGTAGLLSWISTFPIDTIKTRIQSDVALTIKDAIYQRNLFLGIVPCLSRCILVNALGFYAYHLFVKDESLEK